jgi:cell division protein FtsN
MLETAKCADQAREPAEKFHPSWDRPPELLFTVLRARDSANREKAVASKKKYQTLAAALAIVAAASVLWLNTDPPQISPSTPRNELAETKSAGSATTNIHVVRPPATPINEVQARAVAIRKAKEARHSFFQIGAFKRLTEAERAWQVQSARFPLLGAMNKIIVPFAGGYRVRVEAPSTDHAKQACQTLKSGGQDCFLVR